MNEKACIESATYYKPSRRVHIADIASHEKGESNGSTTDRSASVKIFGTVLDKRIFRGKGKVDYGVISVDDGSGSTIQVKSWGSDSKIVERFEQGDMVDIVGRVKYKDGEAYIIPIIVRKIEDPNWETVRELEVIKDRLRRSGARPTGSLQSSRLSANLESEVLEIVESADRSTGILYGELIKRIEHSTEDEIKKALKELLKQGRIYESRPGRYNK
jgi:hypothetical protein